MTEESGILGNLPRSRPGRRSARRDDPDRPAPRSRSEITAVQGQRSTAGIGVGRSRSASAAASRETRAREDLLEPERPGLVSGTVRAAGGAASVGVRVASRLAGGALRRLPRL